MKKQSTTRERRVSKIGFYRSMAEKTESGNLWFKKEVVINWSRNDLIIHFINVSIFAKDKDIHSTSKYVLIGHLLITMEEL